MPNTKGGRKFKRGKKHTFTEKKLICKDPKEEQEYGKITRVLGNGRFTVFCFDGIERTGILAGNMRKRIWINNNDIVLFSKWNFSTNNDKCSIIHKYDEDEVQKLLKMGEFPDNVNLDSDIHGFEEKIKYSFDISDSEEEDEKESESDEEVDFNDI